MQPDHLPAEARLALQRGEPTILRDENGTELIRVDSPTPGARPAIRKPPGKSKWRGEALRFIGWITIGFVVTFIIDRMWWSHLT